ncbi:MAG: neuraminidase [Segetibacter sp.]|nr:neuraminidase [Segetibacter sp.]
MSRILLVVCCLLQNIVSAQVVDTRSVNVGLGWSNNSVNTVAFRKNSLVTFGDTQYISYYDTARYVVLGKRKSGSVAWQLKRTAYQGNTSDAHNTISIIVDGEGYLHVSWDHHNNQLRYSRSIRPGSLELTEKMPMTGKFESAVSYPQFYKMPDGNLVFFYRDGGSGNGNLIINQYDVKTQKWTQLHSNLIDGEGKRNAYWQACTDNKGTIHVSWVWRESPDVASNHDICYARSNDGGKTWQKSNGEKYEVPITAATAEYAWKIPQRSELINQTSMSADEKGNPFIATYWREANSMIPQYHLVYHNGKEWESKSLNFRTTMFTLSGVGSKRIPIARPQVMVKKSGKNASVLIVFRDEERGSKVSAVTIRKIKKGEWKLTDLTPASVGSWEPTFDSELWKMKGVLDLFVQAVEQVDAEGTANIPPQTVQVLKWKPKF